MQEEDKTTTELVEWTGCANCGLSCMVASRSARRRYASTLRALKQLQRVTLSAIIKFTTSNKIYSHNCLLLPLMSLPILFTSIFGSANTERQSLCLNLSHELRRAYRIDAATCWIPFCLKRFVSQQKGAEERDMPSHLPDTPFWFS